MVILDKPIIREELVRLAENFYGDMIKGVVDVDQELLALDAELHSDLLTDCLTVQPLQPSTSPRDAVDRAVGCSPEPGPDLYPGNISKFSKGRPNHINCPCLGP